MKIGSARSITSTSAYADDRLAARDRRSHAFGLSFWQNHALLHLIDRPSTHQTQAQTRAGHGEFGPTYEVAARRP